MDKNILMFALVLGLALSSGSAFAEETTGTDADTATTENTANYGATVTKPLPPKPAPILLERQKELNAKKAELEKKQGERKTELEAKQAERKTEKENRQAELKAKQDERGAALIEKAREKAKQAIERLREQLKKVRERVSNARELPDEDKNALVAQVDAEIAKLDTLKEKAGAATTREELLPIMEEVRKEVRKARYYVSHFTARLLVHRLGKMIEKTDSKIATIEAKIVEIKSGGKDTVAIEALVAEAKGHIAEAKTAYEAGKAQYFSGISEENFENVVRGAATFAKEANKHLILAHKALQRIIPTANKLIRPTEPTTETPAPTTATPIETTTTDSAETTITNGTATSATGSEE